MSDIDLLEREDELAAFRAELASTAQGTGSLMVVSGAAGVGKTRLLEELRSQARDAGFRVLSARGHQQGTSAPYGVVRQLFDPLVATLDRSERAHLFQGPARQAQPILENAPDPHTRPRIDATLNGLWWLVLALADERPLCLVVDDSQWCDLESVQWLAFLANRVDTAPVALAVAIRTGDRTQDDKLTGEITAAPHAVSIRPAPLAEESSRGLVAKHLGAARNTQIGAACHAATTGNPLLLMELLKALRTPAGTRISDPVDVHKIGARAVAGLVARRLEALPTEAVMLARAIAVLGDGTLLQYATQLAGFGEDAGEAAARRLEDAEMVRADGPLYFIHPLIGEAVYQTMTPSQRSDAHVSAALVLRRNEAPIHLIAAQIQLIPPGRYDDALSLLQEAAASALDAGARGSAAAYLRRLLDEALTPSLRATTLRQLGEIETLLDAESAVNHLRQAEALLTDPVQRAQVALALGPALFFTQRNADAVATYQRAIATLPDTADRSLRQALDAGLLAAAVDDSTLYPAARERADALSGLAPNDYDPPLASVLSWHEARTGSSMDRCIALANRGLTLPAGEDTAAIFAYSGLVLAVADRYEQTRAACNHRLEYATSTGSVFDFAIASWLRGIVAYFAGDLVSAEADQRQAIAAGEEYGLSAGLIHGYARLADALVERGELDQAEATLGQVTCPQPLPPLAHYDWYLHTRAGLRLAQQRHAEALRDALEVGTRYESLGGCNPAFIAWRSQAAMAYLGLGEPASAIRYADQEVERARAWGSPRVLGRTLRVAGITRNREGLSLLQDAREVLADSQAVLERARTSLTLGTLQHQLGDPVTARQTLWEGLEEARRCGAEPLARQAHDALIAAGARPRRRSRTGLAGLTPTEGRVATLAATGKTNRELAQALFVSPKTIEMHLGNVFRKLDIQSRTQLGSALKRQT